METQSNAGKKPAPPKADIYVCPLDLLCKPLQPLTAFVRAALSYPCQVL